MGEEEYTGEVEEGEEIKGGVELVKEEAREAAEEVVEGEAAGEAEEEVAIEYDITSPELLQAMLDMADIMEKVARDEMTINEALAYVETRIKELVASSIRQPKRSRRRARTAAAAEVKKASTRRRTRKTSAGRRSRRRKSGSSKESSGG